MITIKIPIEKCSDGSVRFEEYLQEWSALQPLSYYLNEDLREVQYNRIILNGRSIPESPYRDLSPCEAKERAKILNHILPVDGDEIILIPAMQWEAGTIVGIAIGSMIYGVPAWMANAIVYMAISMAVSMIVSSIQSHMNAPSQSKGQAMTSASTAGWNGIQNTFGPGGPIPVPFGRVRCPIHVIHYSVEEEYGISHMGRPDSSIDLSKTKSYVKILGVLCHGRLKSIINIEINENPIVNFGKEIEYYTRLGTLDQTPIPGFDDVETTYEVNVEITETQYTYTTTAGTGVTGFRVHFEAPYGLYFQYQGSFLANAVSYTIYYRKWTEEETEPWTKVDTFRVSANKTTILRWNNKVKNLTSDRYDIKIIRNSVQYQYDNVSGYRIWAAQVTEIYEQNPRAFAGYALIGIMALATEHLSEQPPTITAEVEAIHPMWNGAAWVEDFTNNNSYLARSAMLNTKWGFGNWIPSTQVNDEYFKTFGAYCAECNLLTWSEDFDNEVWVKTDMAVTPGTAIRPGSSTEMSASTLTALAANAIMTQAVTGVESERVFTLYLKRKTGTGDIQLTHSPASEILTWTTITIDEVSWTRCEVVAARLNPYVGIRITESGDEVYAWGAMLNDGSTAIPYLYTKDVAGIPRHACNFLWNQRRKFLPLVREDIIGPARGKLFQVGGKWVVIADRPRTPTQTFTMGNIVKGSLKPQWIDERLNCNTLDVSYLSENQKYNPFAFRVDLGETPFKTKNISYTGVTNGNEAVRDSIYNLNIIRDLHNLMVFEAGVDSIISLPGSLIRFAHEFVRPAGLGSGRAGADSTSLNEVVFDEAVVLEAGKTYQVLVRFSGGDNPDVSELRTIANGPGTHTTLTVTENFSQLVKKYDLCAIGEVGKVYKLYDVLSVKRKNNQTAEIGVIEYNENTYFDHGKIDDTSLIPIVNPANLPPPRIKTVNTFEEIQRQSNNTYISNLQIHWAVPVADPTLGRYLGANIYTCPTEITTILGDFEDAEGWVGGTVSATPGKFKKNQARKVTASGGAQEYTYLDVDHLDLSGDGNRSVGLWIYIEDRSQFYEEAIKIQFMSSGDYFELAIDKEDLSTGFNYILASKDDFAMSGSPDWSDITQYRLFARARVGDYTAVAFFSCFYFFPAISWALRASVEGSTFRLDNFNKGDLILLKLNSFADSPKRPESPYGAYAFTEIAGLDITAPDATDVTLTATSQGSAVLLKWTITDAPSDLNQIVIYRNKEDAPHQAAEIARTGGSETTYADVTAKVNTTYYYWLKLIDYMGNISDFSQVVSILHKYTTDYGGAFYVDEDGELQYAEGVIVLDECDSKTGWGSDSAVSGSIVFSESEDSKMGAGSIQVAMYRYPKTLYYEEGIDAAFFGRFGEEYYCRSFMFLGFPTIKSIGLQLRKVGAVGNVTVMIYSNQIISGQNYPYQLLASATILASDIPTTWQSPPNDYIHAVFDPPIPLGSDIQYWLVCYVNGNSTKYYKIKGLFSGVYEANVLRIGSTPQGTMHLHWDMDFRICVVGDALNKYVFRTISTQDLSSKTYLRCWVKSTRAVDAQSLLKFSIGESAIGEHDVTPESLILGTAWNLMNGSISAISGTDRDGVTKIGFKILNMDEDCILNIDAIVSN